MAKNVITIPATRSRYTADEIGSCKKRKVAAYARVSTDHEEYHSCYQARVDYYTNYINGRGDWEFVSVYADEGITVSKYRIYCQKVIEFEIKRYKMLRFFKCYHFSKKAIEINCQ